jgi:hypothetical protein
MTVIGIYKVNNGDDEATLPTKLDSFPLRIGGRGRTNTKNKKCNKYYQESSLL